MRSACVWELERRGIPFIRPQVLLVVYKGERLDCGYIMDIVVENTIILG
jgi:GxxExxY protein